MFSYSAWIYRIYRGLPAVVAIVYVEGSAHVYSTIATLPSTLAPVLPVVGTLYNTMTAVLSATISNWTTDSAAFRLLPVTRNLYEIYRSAASLSVWISRTPLRSHE
ncbi:unnamed protein product, partial [Ectocarpus sp. 4 AP-2014]